MIECPDSGGDTVFSSQVDACNKLSPTFQERLHGLKAEHCDPNVINVTKTSGGVIKRDLATNIHPLVRTHPATGERASS